MASNNPSMRNLIKIVESVGEAIFEAKERLIYPPIVYDGDGNKKSYELYHDAMANKEVGDTITSHAAAPGMGKITRRITRMDDTGVYGVKIEDTVQIMEPWMVEDSDHGCAQCGRPADGNEELCSECAGEFYEDAGGNGFELEYDSMYGVYRLIVGDQEILLGTDDYEEAQREAEAMMQDPNFYESNKPYAGKGGEPYATMSDGPDKYLFRKDGKQKLVGSKDNEVEDDEVELEETEDDFDYKPNKSGRYGNRGHWTKDEDDEPKFVYDTDEEELEENRFQYEVDGYGYNEEEDYPIDKDDPIKKWHYMTTPEGERVTLDHSPYEEMDKNEFAMHVATHRKGTMENYIREMQIAAGIIVAEDKHRKGAGETECKYCNSKDCDYDCDESQAGGFDESVNEDCPTDPGENADGECSPFTHADENVEMVREDDFEEDLLLAPQDPSGPEVDEDDMVYGKTGKGTYRHIDKMPDDAIAFDDLEGFAGDLGDAEHYDSDIKWPEEVRTRDVDWSNDKEAGDAEHYDDDDMVGGSFAGDPRFDRPVDEEGPGEFDDNEERIIDVGDSEDYEKYDFDNEFETMLGGSSDPVGSYGAGSMYEMNEIRRLAGMEPIEEKKADKDYDGDGEIESSEDEWKGSKDKAIKKAMAEDKADKDYDGDGEIESSEDEWKGSRDKAIKKELDEEDFGALHSGHLDPIPGDVVAYEINDEKAYFLMADLLGAELDFGPEDEILVPAERNDQVIAALTDQGFIEGDDYRVAGQMLDDLQNGYNDRAFSKGQDYFPRGAQSTPASDLGPSASGMADNPMSNKMRMVQKDEVYETMKLAYRRHRKA